MKKIITLLFFVCLYHIGFAQWANLDSAGHSRAAAASFSIGDSGYIVSGGGWDNGWSYFYNTFKYDKSTDSWTQLVDFPQIGENNGSVGFAIGDTGYAGLGVGGGYSYSTSFYKFDTRLNTWTAIAGFPGVGRNEAVSFVINGKAYVGGGLSGYYVPTNDFYAYDPSTGQWSAALAPCPAKGLGVNSTGFALLGKGYVGTGGYYTNGSTNWIPQSDFWTYDPTIDQWDSVASMPCGPRMGAVSFGVGNYGYVGLGVADAGQSQYLKDFWRFDPSTGPLGTWKRIEDYAGGRENAMSFVIGGDGYVYGGIIPYGLAPTSKSLWKYTPDGVTMGGGGGGPLDIEPKSFSVCQGQLVALTVVGDSGLGSSLVWSPSTGLNRPSGDTVLATINSDIVYTVTSGSGCITSSGTDTISVKRSNALIFTPSQPSVCPGQNVTITASGGSNFIWNPSVGAQSTGDSVVATLPSAVNSVVYAVTGLDTSGCALTDSVTLNSGGNVIGGKVTAVRDTICQNTPGNLTLVGSSSNTMQWQLSTDNINFTNAPHDTLASYKTPPLTQSTWYRVMEGAGNCSALSDTLELYVPLPLTASFYNTQPSANTLQFNSDSSIGNIRSYHWDFGDGGTSNDSNPSHTYAKDSTYYVCLTLFDGSNCSYTFCRYSSVTDGVPTISAAGNWVIYPNPFSELLTVSSKHGDNHLQSIEMYDVLGQLVLNKMPGNSTNTSLQLDVSSLAKGMYYVMIHTANADYVQKVVKQ